MSPSTVPTSLTPELWARLQKDGDWYRRNRVDLMARHPGLFVAIVGQDVKATGATVDDLLVELKRSKVEPRHCVVEYVPRPGESLQMIRSF